MRPEFGNEDQIKLLELEHQFKDTKPMQFVDCDCDCENCEAELEKCPYCGEASLDQFQNYTCVDCEKEVIDGREWRTMQSLRAKLLK